MPKRFDKLFKVIVIIMTLCIIFAGCGVFSRPKPQSQNEESGQKKSAPKSLMAMEEETEKIIQQIEDVRKKRAKLLREQEHKSEQEKEKAGQQSQQHEQESGQQKGQEEGQQKEQAQGQQKGLQGQEKSQPMGQQEPKATPSASDIVPKWTELETSVESIHKQWNSFEPTAKLEGLTDDTVDSFEEQLNTLTEQIIARNEENTLIAANTLYSHFPKFFNMYKHNQPPDVKEVKSLTRQIIMYGQQNKWEDTPPLLEDLKKAWQNAKDRMKRPDKNLNSRIDAAINDFAFVVNQKKINLTQIKGEILINNLKEIK